MIEIILISTKESIFAAQTADQCDLSLDQRA